MRDEAWAKAFGLRVRRARRGAGLTQEQVAEQVDRERSWVAGIEAGSFDIPLPVAVALAKALGAPLGDLLP